MQRNKTARQHNFATVPSQQLPRSKFAMRQTRKQAFNASELIPIMCEEVLPGDTWQHTESILARLATPIAPVVDDLDLETFYFFVPNRIISKNWEDLITGVDDTLVVPTVVPFVLPDQRTIKLGSVFDHFGIPPLTLTISVPLNVLPIWGYFTIWNQWFRDQNLQSEWIWDEDWVSESQLAITQDTIAWDQMPLRVNKRHDYFTSSLPFAQKGDPVTLSLGGYAPVETASDGSPIFNFGTNAPATGLSAPVGSTAVNLETGTGQDILLGATWVDPKLRTNLTNVTMATINDIRLASTIQRLLELDARGGSRYVENILAHWGVRAPNFMLQIPEYIGGSKIPVTVNPIAQTAQYNAAPTDEASAVGNLSAEMHASGHKKTFTYAAVEHGYIIGLAVARATPTYQQGVRRHWKRTTRYDFWDPKYDGLGEQAVNTIEAYLPASGVPANLIWGYQERGAEYRYTPNEITGVLRSTAPEPLDWWHYAEEFGAEPALNASFITDKTQETLARSLATAPSPQWSAQIIMDIQHDSTVARLMPTYSVPGISRF